MSGLNWERASRRDLRREAIVAKRASERFERRRKGSGTKGATARQWGYIQHLSEELGIEPRPVATREGASALINELKRRLEARERKEAPRSDRGAS